jgi:hypothetical protein
MGSGRRSAVSICKQYFGVVTHFIDAIRGA